MSYQQTFQRKICIFQKYSLPLPRIIFQDRRNAEREIARMPSVTSFASSILVFHSSRRARSYVSRILKNKFMFYKAHGSIGKNAFTAKKDIQAIG